MPMRGMPKLAANGRWESDLGLQRLRWTMEERGKRDRGKMIGNGSPRKRWGNGWDSLGWQLHPHPGSSDSCHEMDDEAVSEPVVGLRDALFVLVKLLGQALGGASRHDQTADIVSGDGHEDCSCAPVDTEAFWP